MGSVTAVCGHDHELVYFSDDGDHEGATRVTAIVLRRHRAREPEPLSLGDALRRWLASRGKRPPPPPAPVWSMPPEWDAASDGGGPREVLHGRARGLVRVADREFALPRDGRTLVLLVDERDAPPGARPAVTERIATIPPVRVPALHAGLTPAELHRRSRERSERVSRLVHEALFRDADVQRFVRTRPPPAE
jgi:hypothetical protein